MTFSRLPCWLLAASALSTAVCLTGCSGTASVTKEDTARKAVPVKTVEVARQEVRRTTNQPATVEAYYRAEVRARVSGYVEEVSADIGDFVEQGATLAVIHVPEMQKRKQIIEARITRYESEEKRAEAGIELAGASVSSAGARLEQARSELKRADATLAAMEAEFNRTSDLVERQSLERRVLDEVRKKRDSELANRDAVDSAITSAQAEVAVARARQTSAAADLQVAQSETAIARRQLEEVDVLLGFATLKAPYAGLVTQRSLDPGDLVREASEVGNGRPLFVVSQVSTVRVQIPVPEADAAFVSRGDKVTLSFPSFPAEEAMLAEVTRLSGDLDPSTRTMLVEAEVQNPDRKLLPGMFGQAWIELSSTVAANVLPARAIRFDESGKAYVYLVEDDRRISVVPVTVGFDNGHSIEVLSGVNAGQHVIDAHLKRFSTGDTVTVIGN